MTIFVFNTSGFLRQNNIRESLSMKTELLTPTHILIAIEMKGCLNSVFVGIMCRFSDFFSHFIRTKIWDLRRHHYSSELLETLKKCLSSLTETNGACTNKWMTIIYSSTEAIFLQENICRITSSFLKLLDGSITNDRIEFVIKIIMIPSNTYSWHSWNPDWSECFRISVLGGKCLLKYPFSLDII